MRRLLLATAALSLLPLAARAESEAFVLGTGDYRNLEDLERGAEVVEAVDGLARLDFDIQALEDARADGVEQWLGRLVSEAAGAERLLVVLSGRFVTDGQRTWYLTREAAEPRLLSLDERAVSVESLLAVMATAPGPAVLLLGVDTSSDRRFDPFLREGLGRIDPPEGVAVLRGGPRNIANFMADELSVPGGDLRELVGRNPLIAAFGELPPGLVLAPGGRGDDRTEAERAQEAAAWQGAVALDTVEAYSRYIAAYPEGRYVGQARGAIEAIRSEPNRQARLAEEALRLTLDQRREVQRNLTLLDFDPRGIDGIFGPGTRRAITDWQQQNGFPQTSYLDREQIDRLDAQAARRAQQLEAEAQRAREAALRADRAFWEETGAQGDEAGLRAYLDRYPDGSRAEDARAALRVIEERNRRAAQADDRAAWDRALEADSIAGYRAYLEAYPRGIFVEEARSRRDALVRAGDESEANVRARAEEQGLGLNALTARVVEQRLDSLGLDPGEVDGQFDDATRRALRNYQRDRGLPATGFLDEATLVRLLADTLGQALEP